MGSLTFDSIKPTNQARPRVTRKQPLDFGQHLHRKMVQQRSGFPTQMGTSLWDVTHFFPQILATRPGKHTKSY